MGLELWTNYYSIDYHHHNRDTNIKTTYKIDTNPNVGATGSLWLGLEHPAVQSSSHFNSQLNYTSDFYTKPWPLAKQGLMAGTGTGTQRQAEELTLL